MPILRAIRRISTNTLIRAGFWSAESAAKEIQDEVDEEIVELGETEMQTFLNSSRLDARVKKV